MKYKTKDLETKRCVKIETMRKKKCKQHASKKEVRKHERQDDKIK